ncbi:hypothetical protein [Nocardioides pyridinolyticus]
MTTVPGRAVPDPNLPIIRPVGQPTTPGCDSSPMRHARAHAAATRHVIVRSIEPGENWRW